MNLKEAELEGRRSRANGIAKTANPFYHHTRMPRETGEEIKTWQAKTEAWEKGWDAAGNEPINSADLLKTILHYPA